jgi:MFS transporter, DHA3 family, macrolide efflux protein
VLATATLVGLLPQVFIMPFAGTFVDRWSRRMTMIVADGLIALATLCLAFLFWTGHVQVWQVYTVMFIRALLGGFHWSAMQASTSLMVPGEHLARIQGLNQMLSGGMNILSAPLGALLIETLSFPGVMLIDISTAMLAILPLLFIPVPQPPRRAAQEASLGKSSYWYEFRAGLRYAFGWPGLMLIGVMAALINFLLAPASSLVPILVTKYFNGQVLQLAWMEAAFGLGVVLGGLLLSVWGGFKRRIYTSLLGLLGIAFGGLLIGLLPPTAFPLAVVGMFIIGVAVPNTNGPLFAAVQAVVLPDMQGRVFTLMGGIAGIMMPLGLLIAGPVADAFGVQTWFLVGGIVTAFMGVAGFFIPAIVHFEDNQIASPAVGQELPGLPADAE